MTETKKSIETEKLTANWINKVSNEMGKQVIGQKKMIERMMIALLCNQHILIEGVPGIAKTLTVNSLASALSLQFSRIQFTPDLLPSDLVGTLIYNPSNGTFTPRKGPVFANLILADEINRAPAKVQSALLECMQEKQVTIGDKTFKMDRPFMVMATQNPIDQEGTYPLPEAQIDRFMMKIIVDYPSKDDEFEILNRHSTIEQPEKISSVSSVKEIEKLSKAVDSVYLDDKIKKYIVDLVQATRKPSKYGIDIDSLITFGASPRAVISLAQASRAYALIQGRDWAGAEDVREVAYDVLRHRIMVSYEALAEEKTADYIITEILNNIKIQK